MPILLSSLGYWVLSNCSRCFLCQLTFSTPTGQISINYYNFLLYYFEIVLHVKIHDAIDHEKYELKIDHKGNFSTLVQNLFIRLKPNTSIQFYSSLHVFGVCSFLQVFWRMQFFYAAFSESYEFSCFYFEQMMCFSDLPLFKII